MPRFTVFTLATLLAVAPAAPATTGRLPQLPAMGDSSAQALPADIEAAIGRQIVRQLRAGGQILEDPQVTEYLQSLGSRLGSHGGVEGQRYSFFLVDSPDINAFALPGGFVGINAGLFTTTQNESELAGVLAHEIAHVTQRHTARQLEQASRMNIVSAATMLSAILIGVSSGSSDITQAGIAAGQAMQIQDRIDFTRVHEHEADRVGIATLASAGFDPAAVATMFEQLERRARLSGANIPDFLRTHPVNAARVAEARDRARAYGDVRATENRAYPLMRARARALSTRPADAREWFRETLRTAPADERDALRYGLALTLVETGATDEARELLADLLERDDDIVYYHLALAHAEFTAGELDPALARYERAMRLFPRSVAVTQAYAQALLYAGRGRDALPHLIALLPQQDPEPQLFRLLAMSAGAAGELADAHYFMSEVHVLSGQLMPAIDQLQLALSIPGINQQQRARAEARLEQLAEFMPRGRRVRLDRPIPQPRPGG